MLQTKGNVPNQLESIRRSEDRYQKMLAEISDYAIIVMDLEGTILNWNLGAEKIKGYKPEEILGKNFRIFYSPEDQQAHLPEQLLKEAAQQGRAAHEGWRIRKDGTKFWGSIVITALHDENQNVYGYLKITRDLSEQKAAEVQLRHYVDELLALNGDLRESEDRYHRMIDEVQDYAILLLDNDGTILNWNKGAQNIKGYKPDEIIGKSFTIFYSQQDRINGLPFEILNEARKNGKASYEGWRIRKDGTRFWGNVVITALHNDENEVIAFSKVTRDLTERKLAEDTLREYTAQLERNNEELEQFAYVASHDLKEPLRKVLTFGNLLEASYKNVIDEKGKEYIQRMQNAAKRMMILIEDLLTFSRVSRPAEGFELVDLKLIVNRVLSDLEITTSSTKAKVTIGSLPIILGRKSQLEQLFQNLISNAIKFNDKEFPIISISSEIIEKPDRNPGFVKISVKDNGIGFEDIYSNRIFEIFQRLHGKNDYPGTGIGLSIVKKIVAAHNGTISASGVPGQGSTFEICLPLPTK